MLELLSNHRTPTCPHCSMAKLETEDIIHSSDETTDTGKEITIEQHIGFCPNCEHRFDYIQRYTHDPIGYDSIEDITEDEEDEEDDT